MKMRRTLSLGLVAIGIVIGACIHHLPMPAPMVVTLYAQTLPSVRTVSWVPNPATDNVVSYAVTLDSGTPVIVQATSCTLAQCSGLVSVPSFGAHSVVVTASNLDLSGGAGVIGTPQNSTPSVAKAFNLNPKPGTVAGTVGIQ